VPGKRILMGVIGRPHGVRGLLHVHSYAAQDLAGYSPLLDEQGRAWTLAWRGEGIAELRDPQGRAVPDRTAAERLVNVKLYVERDRLPAPDGDDFYLADLVDMTAVGADGVELGRVVQVHDYGAGASLEVAGAAASLIVPFTRAAVPEVDVAAGRLVVVPPAEVELPLPLAGAGRGEGGGNSPEPRRERTTLTQPSPASGRGLEGEAPP
jgi:16S rRNA processing protein RimM